MKLFNFSLSAASLKIIFLFLVSFFITSNIQAVPVNQLKAKITESKNLKIKDLEKKLGRKLKLKEKLAVHLFKRKLKKEKKKEKNWARTAFWLSIAGLIPFVGFLFGLAGFFVGIASLSETKNAKNKTSYQTFAFFAIILGLIFFVLNIGLLLWIQSFRH